MAKRGGFPGGGIPGNMNNLMKQAQKMQRQMEENQKALEEKEFTAAAGGGVVEVTISGKKEVTKVSLKERSSEKSRGRDQRSHVKTDRRTYWYGWRISVLMDYYSSHITKLIEELSKLPGVGAKSAQRLAFHIINRPIEEVQRLSDTIIDARKNVRYCKECFTLTDDELCPICKNDARDHKTIMVVENTRDLAAYEKTGKYDGVYHVLHGAISPMLGIGPGDIKLKELMTRLQGDVNDCYQFQPRR